MLNVVPTQPPVEDLIAEQWFRKDCPRHSTYIDWITVSRFYVKLSSVAKKKKVEEHPILSFVLVWAWDAFKVCQNKSFAARCSCDDDYDNDTEGAATLRLGASWASRGASDIANLDDVE